MATTRGAGAKPVTSSTFYILLALADQDRHGLGIADEIARRTDMAIDLGPGTLYHAIKKTLAAGLIRETPHPPDPNDDDPRRRYYTISAAGRRTLEAETRRLARLLDVAEEKLAVPTARPAR
jgi:DNA-binding PadR family transcriptional regulator